MNLSPQTQRELVEALAKLDLYIDFGTPYESGDMNCGYDDATGANAAMEEARIALAKARAEIALGQPQPLGGAAGEPADEQPAADRAPETR